MITDGLSKSFFPICFSICAKVYGSLCQSISSADRRSSGQRKPFPDHPRRVCYVLLPVSILRFFLQTEPETGHIPPQPSHSRAGADISSEAAPAPSGLTAAAASDQNRIRRLPRCPHGFGRSLSPCRIGTSLRRRIPVHRPRLFFAAGFTSFSAHSSSWLTGKTD